MTGVQVTIANAPSRSAADFEALVLPLVREGLGLATAMLGSAHDAEDATQEALVKAWRRFGGLRRPEVARAWFLAIVANQCRDQRRSRWFSVLRLADPDAGSYALPDLAAAVDLEARLAALSRSDRAALYLHFYLDLPVAEVARVLRVTAPAARQRIHRACRRLRPGLEEVELP